MTPQQARACSEPERLVLLTQAQYRETVAAIDSAIARAASNPFGDKDATQDQIDKLNRQLNQLDQEFYGKF